MELSEKVLGQKINDTIMRHTFYGQFVAGNSLEEINERHCFESFISVNNILRFRHSSTTLMQSRIHLSISWASFYWYSRPNQHRISDERVIIDLLKTIKSSGLLNKCGVRPMLAVPIEENLARKNDESFYDENLAKILACLKLSEEIADNRKMMQVRITAFINPDILVMFR